MRIALIVIFVVILSACGPPSGSFIAEQNPTATVCCSFEYNGTIKSCSAPEGQSCSVCEQVCDQKTT